jgi:1,4-alpha-glucan branching enzyme
MYAQAAKKLLFMGGEFGQWGEWCHDGSLEWHLTQYPPHQGLQRWITDLNHLYRNEPALHERDLEPAGFEWIDCNDAEAGVITLMRKGKTTGDMILVACNFTPVPRLGYRIGAPRGGLWKELLNSDATDYNGSGIGNKGALHAESHGHHGRPYSLVVTLPPLAALFFKSTG